MKRKKMLILFLPFLLLFFSCFPPKILHPPIASEISIIPAPAHLQKGAGKFLLTSSAFVVADTSDSLVGEVVRYFTRHIQQATGVHLTVYYTPPDGKTGAIRFQKIKDGTLGREGYRLKTSPEGISLEAGTAAGLFYGVQTIFQLLPPEIYSQNDPSNVRWTIPAVTITDRPRYPWRGFMLDVSRHFFTKNFIKKQIDYLAYHKMNRLHLHLTDDQGWRIEIKKYPKLTQISSWRRQSDGTITGGYYTQDDIRELVAYAQSRFVTIVPEIEMPGHCQAALAAYPQLSCTGGPFPVATEWGVHKDVYCAGNDSTFAFLQNVLLEIMQLFPSPVIHIGGDEVPKDRWQHCPKCQARIKAEGLKDEAELQSYFIRRIEKFLNAHGKRLLGWDEILEGGLAPNAMVMSWRGTQGGIAAAKQNHDVIMSPTSFCYFDYYQGDPKIEPLAIGGNLPIEKVYRFEPSPKNLSPEEARHVLGGQANLWTEYVATPEHAEYMTYPRLAAMAEVLWSPKENRNWPGFLNRLQTQLKRYNVLGIHYARSLFAVQIQPTLDPSKKGWKIKLAPHLRQTEVHYTLDGRVPTFRSPRYKAPFFLKHSASLRATAFLGQNPVSAVSQTEFLAHRAIGCRVNLKNPPNSHSQSGGDFALSDGLLGSKFSRDGRWQGFRGTDFVGTIDFQKPVAVQKIRIRFLQNIGAWIFLPQWVEFFISTDGTHFKSLGKFLNPVSPHSSDVVVKEFGCSYSGAPVRFVRVLAKNRGVCPPWHPGAGGKAWLFTDEIIVD